MPKKPIRVQLSRKKGWRIPPDTKVVSRPTRWGNPFPAADAAQRAKAVARYRTWIESDDGKSIRQQARECLRGYNLACWCPLDGPCHADILLKIANT
ncbi:MAG: DUF4326 domain-containing protein [Nibricoccus sp.]